jgi:hypothetical protein
MKVFEKSVLRKSSAFTESYLYISSPDEKLNKGVGARCGVLYKRSLHLNRVYCKENNARLNRGMIAKCCKGIKNSDNHMASVRITLSKMWRFCELFLGVPRYEVI